MSNTLEFIVSGELPPPLLVIDGKGRFLYANRCARKEFGIEDMKNNRHRQRLRDFLTPDSREIDLPRFTNVLKSGASVPVWLSFSSGEGKSLTYKVIPQPLSSFDKTIQGWLLTLKPEETRDSPLTAPFSMIANSTEVYSKKFREMRLELERLRQQNEMNAILSVVGTGILFARNNKIEWVNDALCEMLGYERSELEGNDLQLICCPSDEKRYKEISKKAFDRLRQYGRFILEIEHRRKDGTLMTCINTAVAIYPNDPSKGTIVSFTDITKRKETEQQQQKLLAELSARNRELDSFVFTVSHDLKNPLVTIGGFINLLYKNFGNVMGEDGKKYLTRITKSVKKMESLINDLLNLSRIGRLTGKKTMVSFGELVADSLSSMNSRINDSGIKVKVPKDLPYIFGVKKRLGQVIDNLMDNAIKYIGEDNPTPYIEVDVKEDKGEQIFFVKDNGIGIEKKYHDKIFGIFQRLPYPKKIEGTGIGLTIVKRIIELHGGQVWVESEKGKGSTFFFTVNEEI